MNHEPSTLNHEPSTMNYFIKTPWLVRKLYSFYTWRIPATEKNLFLTFDDGPHPEVTNFVLNELRNHNALATFFCIGKNVLAYPETYKRILDEGHSVGNHTQNHLNGWKTPNDVYMKDIAEAANHIDSNLFRPPYGKISLFQARNLRAAMKGRKAKVIMWDILSADFDSRTTNEDCLQNVIFNSKPGSIIVMHDSEKCFEKLKYCLPKILHHFTGKGFKFLSLQTS